MAQKTQAQEHISNLSVDLMSHALELIQQKALPVYKRNVATREWSIAHGEFGPSAIAALLLASGVDYHLARLKSFRDVFPEKPPLPHTPYFNWEIGDFLPTKIERLLIKPGEGRLREQLLEFTSVRDSVAHPKLYFIRQLLKPDYTVSRPKARLVAGATHKQKTLRRKLKRSEMTASLHLPLVPTWISYVDIVICVLVMNRFLNLLERKYGPYAYLTGGFSVQNIPTDFFHGWGSTTRKSISFSDWTGAFFDSLSPADKQKVQKRLGDKVSKYLQKYSPPIRVRKKRNGEYEFVNPPPPDFLRKPPPWKVGP
ncbi:MAG: hypothetical protein Q8L74_12835 [Nitrospirota bacterium]|nr:hypothetical protein [Nitrospirota bacterium]